MAMGRHGPPMSGKTVVALEAVSKTYGAVRALDTIDLAVYEGELLAVLGPSGCGKTTTLNVIAGFVVPDAGRVMLDGDDVTTRPAWRRGLGMVFQSYALFPHMSVGENVGFGLRERGVARPEAATRVTEALALVRLPDAARLMPAQLSGGMQQRVALARALVIRPRVLLLDEPLAALDRKLREEMRAEVKSLHRRLGTTFVFVTHDQEEALALSDRVVVMNDGVIEQMGSPAEIYDVPRTRFVAEFLAVRNILSAEVQSVEGAAVVRTEHGLVLRSRAGGFVAGERVWVGVRPERMSFDGAGENRIAGVLEDRLFLGDRSEWRVRAGADVLTVSEPGTSNGRRAGDAVTVTFEAAALLRLTEPARRPPPP
jgi:ABC-type Fe3+/spermidine/putrescine transport system ATPase subunit